MSGRGSADAACEARCRRRTVADQRFGGDAHDRLAAPPPRPPQRRAEGALQRLRPLAAHSLRVRGARRMFPTCVSPSSASLPGLTRQPILLRRRWMRASSPRMTNSATSSSRSMQPIISVANLSKTYASGYQALKSINLDIRPGEIFALLGPNGAGKTTLINIICGIVTASAGAVRVDGRDIGRDYRIVRAMIGLVPQELTTDAFESVWNTVTFSRGLFGKRSNPAYIEKVLRELTLWDRKDSKIMTLSGGMKRRVMIAKALSHEPHILFLDEPTAGVDVELRRDMWEMVRSLRANGVTIILTTHYIEEAEEMADRIGVISKGELILVEDKAELMHKLGKKQLTLHLQNKLDNIPLRLAEHQLHLSADGSELIYTYDAQGERTGITAVLKDLNEAGILFKDLHTSQSSLEEIFVSLVRGRK